MLHMSSILYLPTLARLPLDEMSLELRRMRKWKDSTATSRHAWHAGVSGEFLVRLRHENVKQLQDKVPDLNGTTYIALVLSLSLSLDSFDAYHINQSYRRARLLSCA